MGRLSQTIVFEELTPVYFFNMAKAVISMPNNGDVITIDSPKLSDLQNSDPNAYSAITGAGLTDGQFNRVSGTVRGVPIEAAYFQVYFWKLAVEKASAGTSSSSPATSSMPSYEQ